MMALIDNQWRELWKTLPGKKSIDDPATIHKVRVASRRLRAAMDISVDAFPQDWYRPLHKVARQTTGAFGGVRDADVQIGEIEQLGQRAEGDEKDAISYLIEILNRDRAEAETELQSFLKKLGSSDTRKETSRRFGVRDSRKSRRKKNT